MVLKSMASMPATEAINITAATVLRRLSAVRSNTQRKDSKTMLPPVLSAGDTQPTPAPLAR